MEFVWDTEKALKNYRKHGVSFNESATVFDDPLSVTVADPAHSEDEERYIIVGMSKRRRLLIVSHAERGNRIRIISARELDRDEREEYETGNFG